ncbi:MAG TPA: hypothetical protein VNS58_17105 [Puia sp.]|nr:hypothetical protein [Puia sp.]
MYVKKIQEVKQVLDQMKENKLIDAWELPYENLLTRLNAAIFFIVPSDHSDADLSAIRTELDRFDDFSYRANSELKLSKLPYRVTFNADEKIKNLQSDAEKQAMEA